MQYWIANINIQTYHIEEAVIELSMQKNNFYFQNSVALFLCSSLQIHEHDVFWKLYFLFSVNFSQQSYMLVMTDKIYRTDVLSFQTVR